MITGKDIENYINDHSVVCYNSKKDETDDMISVKDVWDLILRVTLDISAEINGSGEEYNDD